MSTIKDVARIACVSTGTVSRVLNDPSAVKKETRERVLRAMKKCDYTYNALARGLAIKKFYTLGLIVPKLTNPFFSESAQAIEDYARRRGYHVIIGSTHYDNEREAELITEFRKMQVRGLMITSNHVSKMLQDLAGQGFPLVSLYTTTSNKNVTCVTVDYIGTFYKMVGYLVKLNHRRIAFIGFKKDSERFLSRWKGYRKALKDNEIEYDPNLVAESGISIEGGYQATLELLKGETHFSAAVCCNDIIAVGALKALKEKGLKIPQDVSLIGFGDIDMASLLSPALTTVRLPAYQIGEKAVEILLDKIDKKSSGDKQHVLETEFVIRNSCQKILG